MNGNIVGEPFDEFVRDQINTRQRSQFGGYDAFRTNDQLQYLTNRNAWVKLASSVKILDGVVITAPSSTRSGAGSSSTQTLPSSGGFNVGTGQFGNTLSSGQGGGSVTATGAPNTGLGSGVIASGATVAYYKPTKLTNIGFPDPSNYSGTQLAQKTVLFNTISEYISGSALDNTRAGVSNTNDLWNDKFAYGIGGTDYGIQPPPGIIGVSVDSINRGSIRKANITLKAHNKFQFDVIELLYLRLGFTMMLEWGWDRYLDTNGNLQQVKNTIIETEWFTSNGISQLDMLSKIQTMRKTYQGNVDGFFGKVSNFSWTFNPDGSYDITIDLITVGDVIESIKANTFSKGTFKNITSTQANTEQEAKKVSLSPDNIILKAAAVSAIVEHLYKWIQELNKNSGTITPGQFITARAERIENIVEYYEISSPPANGKTIGSQYYVRLGTFLAQLENLIIPRVENGISKTPQLTINYTTENNLISFFPNQISLDPRICIFKPDFGYGDITGITFPAYLDSLETYVNPISTSRIPQTYGNLMNLYINIEYIAGLVTSNGSPSQDLPILKLLQDLCNGINDALGGVNKLEPVIKNDNIITIIDQTLISPEEDIVELEVYGYHPAKQTSNFVKNISFVSKITPQLASMISIGATAAGSNTSETDGTAFSKFSEGLVDRFTEKIVEPKLLDPNTTTPPDVTKLGQEWDDFEKAGFFTSLFEDTKDKRVVNDPRYGALNGTLMGRDRFIKLASYILRKNAENNTYFSDDLATLVSTNYAVYLVEAFSGKLDNVKIYSSTSSKPIPFERGIDQAKYTQFNDTFIDQGKGAYKNYINSLNNERYNTDKIASSEIGFIPLSFELTLDGISGIKIYNKLSINNKFLPTNYPESLNFVITKVNHQISNNNWDTSLSTISMPVTKPYQYNTTSQGSSGGGTGNTGNTGGGNTGSTTSYPVFTSRGPQPGQQGSLQLLKDLIGLRETSSTSNYGIANRNGNALRSTTNVENLTFDELLRLSKLPDNQQNLNRVFAAGKFQVIPSTLEDIKKAFGFGGADKFTKENQEKIGDYLLLNSNTSRAFGLGRYLRGDNAGSEKDLEDAIQAVGQIWASFPIIYNSSKNKVGFVVTGDGNTAYYGGSGANPKTVKLTIQDIVKYMIQTRINYSSKLPSFIPTYY